MADFAAVHARLRQPPLRALDRCRDVPAPLGHRVAQPPNHHRQADRRDRRVLLHEHVDKRVQSRTPMLRAHRRPIAVSRGVNPDAAIAPDHAQPALVVQCVEQVRGGVRRASPIVGDGAMGKVGVNLARMDESAFAAR